MQRILLAAAVATLAAGPALAQNTTIYGRLNLTVERQNANGAKSTVMVNNSSRIGFRGTEDMGGGLKAGYVLEHGFSPDTGLPNASFWGRQSELNLSSGFGMLRLGTYTSEAYFATADYISMHNHDTGPSADALYAYLGRNVNKVAYRTPSLGGATVEAAMSLKENGANHTYDLAANWKGGPVHLGAGYEKNAGKNQFAARVLVEAGAFAFGGYLQRDKNAFASGNRNNVRVSAMYGLGNSEFHVNVGHSGKYSSVANSAATQYTLGYNYNLSKRTKVYSYYTKVDDDAKLYTGGDFSSLAVGIRHNF